MTDAFVKYPRTWHIEGSGLPKGDHDWKGIPFADIRGKFLVVEEKLDGANVGISFTATGELRLQSRGHYLTGGPDEAPFALLKPWAQTHAAWLRDVLADRYILYAEWLFAKHTVFYDALPHYLLEFDLYDTTTGDWLSTERRHALLASGPVVSVPVLRTGAFFCLKDLTDLIQPSLYKTSRWQEALREAATTVGADPERALLRETDPSDFSEGLYIKHEEGGRVIARYKWVRADFIRAILDSGSHWRDRSLIQNGLAAGVDLFAPGEAK